MASTDNVGVTGYKIYRNGSQVGASATTTYTDTTVQPGTTYSYRVSAYDAAGNNSAQSSPPAVVTTPADTTPPSVPTGVAAIGQTPSSIGVTWSASTDDVGVTGYRVYRNGGLVGASSSTSFVDLGLEAAATYTYTVAAHDAKGNQSAQSSPAIGRTLDALSVAQARTLPNYATVGLASARVSAVFDICFYVEDEDRTAGIRVMPKYGTAGLFVGATVDIGGKMFTVNHERMIASALYVVH